MNNFPPPLNKGDCIGIVAPSSKWDIEKVAPTVSHIEELGYKVKLHPQTQLSNNQFAGKASDKVSAIYDYFLDPDIKAIFCLVGGNGVLHILNKLDYSVIRKNPKIFMGFSDITALLHAIHTKVGLITFHGPTLTNMARIKPSDLEQCFSFLHKPVRINLQVETDIEAEGTLFGGNLSMLQALIGTGYAPPLDQDNILFIEDTNDHLSRYDRMITHMALSGWFKNTKAILIGEFLNTQDNAERPFGFSIEEILSNHAPNVPIVKNIPVGHGNRLITLPIGAHTILKNGALSFKSS